MLLMQTTVKGTSTRIAIQSALKRYYDGNQTTANWARSIDDLQAVFQGAGAGFLMVQAQIYPFNSSAQSVVNSTATDLQDLVLPFKTPNGENATLGDPQYGFIDELYPKFTTEERYYNDTVNTTVASWNGREISNGHYLLCGPIHLNDSLSLVSITMPIINNTSNIEVLGWLTGVLDAHLIVDVVNAMEGLDDTGLTMLFGPDTVTNKFSKDTILYNTLNETKGTSAGASVRFVLPPTPREEGKTRHTTYGAAQDAKPFNWTRFPAIDRAYTEYTGTTNNAGSIISTSNEDDKNVAVGYASVNSSMVDWVIVVEQEHGEVWAPINRLRNLILACVFGTMGAMLVLVFPVAHYSSRPIRRLRDATKRTVSPQPFDDDSLGSHTDGADDEHAEALARKEGFFGKIKHFRRNRNSNRAERREAERRRQFRIPAKVKDRKHFIHDELTDLTKTFNEMTDELMMQYEKLEERVAQRTAELEQSKKAAEAANESKTLFIANISHELKTPLNGILGMCAVCMSEDDPVKLRRSLGIIYKSGDLLLNLLTDLLTFR
jgi:osomolarity two-component system sensor histidine kinase SLN1